MFKSKKEESVKEFYALFFQLLFRGLREGVLNRSQVDEITDVCLGWFNRSEK